MRPSTDTKTSHRLQAVSNGRCDANRHCETRQKVYTAYTSDGTKDDVGSAVQEFLEVRIAVGQDLCTGHDSRGITSLLLGAWIDGIEQICDAGPEEGSLWIAMFGWDLVISQSGRMRLKRPRGERSRRRRQRLRQGEG